MANIVIVEDDERAVNEISQFIKEISEDHNIRSFKTAEHFIKRYCKAQQLAGLTEANSAESLKLYDDEQLKLLTELDYASTPGFKGPKVSMQIEPQKFTTTKLTMTQPG